MNSTLAACARRTTRWAFFQWYWGDAIAIDGLLAASEHGIAPARSHAIDSINRWYERCPTNFDDVLAPGRALIDLAASGDIPDQAARRFIDAVRQLPTTSQTIPLLEPHRPTFRFGICIDTVYHLPPALAAYGRWQSDHRLVQEAVKLANDIMRVLSCQGGWAQWYDCATDRNNAAVWTRGLGWALLGLLDLIEIGDNVAGIDECHDSASQILQLLANTIGDQGTWPSLLHDHQADQETSTTAFFITASNHPALDPAARPAQPVLELATDALTRSMTPDGTLHGVSADILPSFDLDTYRHFTTEPSPWGQGAALRALVSLA